MINLNYPEPSPLSQTFTKDGIKSVTHLPKHTMGGC